MLMIIKIKNQIRLSNSLIIHLNSFFIFLIKTIIIDLINFSTSKQMNSKQIIQPKNSQQGQTNKQKQENHQQQVNSNPSKKLIESKVISQQPLFQGKWLGLKYTNYSIGQHVVNNYETCYRTTTLAKKLPYDGVQIIPIVKYPISHKTPEVLVIANFRPPVGKFVLEFPSGLLESQDFQQNARREVLQQTGWVISSFVPLPTPGMYCDPWKSNQCGLFYLGIIDGDDKGSYKGQQLQSQENIVVYRMPLKGLMGQINKLVQQEGFAVQGKVWSICIGLQLMGLIGN